MGKANSESGPTGKMFSENTVAIILMATGTVSISNTQYAMMSAMDGQKTASAFQHHFRSVLQKAKEFKQRVENGESFTAVQPGKKRAAATAFQDTTPPVTPKKAKGTPKPRTKKSKASVSDDHEAADDDHCPKDTYNGNGAGSPGEFHVTKEDIDLEAYVDWDAEV